ncbi:unnamed protein product [Meganyctiphanes norvegica]|uniref:Uncharacterized protein n=1 Tax=Meganyctiphanes norvegica TaxID=48144 RepID=A0AAV2S377_MEGNR
MKTAVIVLCLAAMALADTKPLPLLLRSNIVNIDEDGAHSMDIEVDNGVSFQLSGRQGENGGANMIGSYKMLNAEGELVDVKFVANEFGFQPESSLLPVAPAFPHPIPQFVLDQIAFAEQQRRAQSQEQ